MKPLKEALIHKGNIHRMKIAESNCYFIVHIFVDWIVSDLVDNMQRKIGKEHEIRLVKISDCHCILLDGYALAKFLENIDIVKYGTELPKEIKTMEDAENFMKKHKNMPWDWFENHCGRLYIDDMKNNLKLKGINVK